MAQSFQATLDEFLDSTIDPGGQPLDTRIALVPECEVRASVSGIRPSKFKNDDGEWRALVEISFSINDPEIKEETQLDDPRAVYVMFLDTRKDWDGEGNPPLEHGKNKNTGLARLLEGFGMNDGRKFKWSMFMHEDAWIRVGRPRTAEDRFAPVVAIGRDEESVKRPNRRK